MSAAPAAPRSDAARRRPRGWPRARIAGYALVGLWAAGRHRPDLAILVGSWNPEFFAKYVPGLRCRAC